MTTVVSQEYEPVSVAVPAIGSNSSGNQAPIISWDNISVKSFKAVNIIQNIPALIYGNSKLQGKEILHGISGQVNGGLHAFLGMSGSGKTTLLNVLAYRLDPIRMGYTGDLRINGKPYREKEFKTFGAYVSQDPVVFAEFTVYETLWYTSELILRGKFDYQKRIERVNEVIKLFGLEHCRNIIVGDSRHKGISGGELKRLYIAASILSKPKIIFLDEPTTGLDSLNAHLLISSLQELVRQNNCTVIATIHQPQKKTFELFDTLTLLRHGKVAYQGNVSDVVGYFKSIGFEDTYEKNPANHLLNVLAINSHTITDENDDFVYFSPKVDISLGSDYPPLEQTFKANLFWQSVILTLRCCHVLSRRKLVLFTALVSDVIIASIVGFGGYFTNLGNTFALASRRNSLLAFCALHQGLTCSFQSIYSFPIERAIILRERHSGYFNISAYVFAKSISEFLFSFHLPIIWSLIVYFPTGLDNTAHKFGNFMWIMILASLGATSLTTMLSCIFVSYFGGVIMIAVAFELARLYGGFYIPPIAITTQFKQFAFLDALSYQKYSFVGLALNEWRDLAIECTKAQKKSATGFYCSGNTVIEHFGYNQYTVENCCGYLIVLITGFRVLTYLGLKFIKI